MFRTGVVVLATLIPFAGSLEAQSFVLPDDSGTQVVSACTGSVLDPGGSGNYSSGQSGKLVVYPDRDGVEVELEVIALDIDPGNDILRIDGGPFAGSGFAGIIGAEVSVGKRFVGSRANSGALTVDFIGQVDGRSGFEMTIRCHPHSDILVGDTRIHDISGKKVFDSGGPDGPYSANEALDTQLSSSAEIHLQVSDVDIEPCCDGLEVSNGGGVSQGTVPGTTEFESHRLMNLEFRSDTSVEGGGFSGKLDQASPLVTNQTGTSIISPQIGLMDSGGFLAQYGPNQNLTRALSVRTRGTDLAVEVNTLSLGAGDTLQIYPGDTPTGPPLATLTKGSLSPSLLVEPGSDTITVNFQSDAAEHGDWGLSFSEAVVMHANRTATTCGASIMDSGGPLGDYSNGEDVVVTLKPDNPSAWLELSFVSFVTEAAFDVLDVFDGDSIAAPLLGSFSGNVLPPTIRTSPVAGRAMTLRFRSDGSVVDPGFVAIVECSFSLFRDGFEGGNASGWSSAIP